MVPLPILLDMHTVSIASMLNLNGGINGHWPKNVNCKQTFRETTNSVV